MGTQRISQRASEIPVRNVDVVFPGGRVDLDVLFDRRVRKLVGALQRRFWERRRRMLQTLAVEGNHRQAAASSHGSRMGLLADLSDPLLDWEARLGEYATIIERCNEVGATSDAPAIRIRGWGQTEAGILIDGRAGVGCIVDLAVVLGHSAEALRSSQGGAGTPTIHIPAPTDPNEEKLWVDLLDLAQDKLGVERGTIKMIPDLEPSSRRSVQLEAVA